MANGFGSMLQDPRAMMAMNYMSQMGPSRMPKSTGSMVGSAGLNTMNMAMQQKMMQKKIEQADKEMELSTKRMEMLSKRFAAEEKLKEQLGLAQFDPSTEAGRYGMGQGLMTMGGQAGNMKLFGTGASLARGMPGYEIISEGGVPIGVMTERGFSALPRDEIASAIARGLIDDPQKKLTPPAPAAPSGPGLMSSLMSTLTPTAPAPMGATPEESMQNIRTTNEAQQKMQQAEAEKTKAVRKEMADRYYMSMYVKQNMLRDIDTMKEDEAKKMYDRLTEGYSSLSQFPAEQRSATFMIDKLKRKLGY
jgi:hypothetical protein